MAEQELIRKKLFLIEEAEIICQICLRGGGKQKEAHIVF